MIDSLSNMGPSCNFSVPQFLHFWHEENICCLPTGLPHKIVRELSWCYTGIWRQNHLLAVLFFLVVFESDGWEKLSSQKWVQFLNFTEKLSSPQSKNWFVMNLSEVLWNSVLLLNIQIYFRIFLKYNIAC